jgi:hypothetical protein
MARQEPNNQERDFEVKRTFGRYVVCLVAVSALALVVSGCNRGHDYGPTGTVSGTLSYKGQPVAAGTAVVFMNMTAGHTCMGATDAQGNYTLDSWNDGDMPVGTYDVMIRPSGPEMDANPAASDIDNPDAGPAEEIVFDFPKKYGALATSGLKFEVKEGANDIAIDLVD